MKVCAAVNPLPGQLAAFSLLFSASITASVPRLAPPPCRWRLPWASAWRVSVTCTRSCALRPSTSCWLSCLGAGEDYSSLTAGHFAMCTRVLDYTRVVDYRVACCIFALHHSCTSMLARNLQCNSMSVPSMSMLTSQDGWRACDSCTHLKLTPDQSSRARLRVCAALVKPRFPWKDALSLGR